MKQRLLHVIRVGAVIAAVGLLYALFVNITGWAIPCPFHELTGLLCPGCGITRMCLALLSLDFKMAFSYNAGVLMALPVLALCLAVWTVRYVRTGNREWTRMPNTALVLSVIWLVLFGIMRNLCNGGIQ